MGNSNRAHPWYAKYAFDSENFSQNFSLYWIAVYK